MTPTHAPISTRQGRSSEKVAAMEVLSMARARFLAPGDAESGPDMFRYGHDVSGLHLLIALDSGPVQTYLRDEDMERLGHDAAWAAAINNLFSHGVAAPERLEGNGGAFFSLESESAYQATWLAFPDELFSRLGLTVGVQGAFLTVPASNILNLHVIGEGTTFGDLDRLMGITRRQFEQHPSAFSPHLYWWDGFAVHQLSSAREGRFGLRLPESLEESLAR